MTLLLRGQRYRPRHASSMKSDFSSKRKQYRSLTTHVPGMIHRCHPHQLKPISATSSIETSMPPLGDNGFKGSTHHWPGVPIPARHVPMPSDLQGWIVKVAYLVRGFSALPGAPSPIPSSITASQCNTPIPVVQFRPIIATVSAHPAGHFPACFNVELPTSDAICTAVQGSQ